MKGVVPIAVGAIVASLIITGIVFSSIVIDTDTIQRTAREVTIIDAINTVEFAKRSLEQSVIYSFYQSSYDISKFGGYIDLTGVNTVDGLPVWRNYADTTGFPTNYAENLESETLIFFNSYAGEFRTDKLSVPSFTEIKISVNEPTATVYEDPDFEGSELLVTQNVPDLSVHNMYKKISSLKVSSGTELILCAENNECRSFTSDVPDLLKIHPGECTITRLYAGDWDNCAVSVRIKTTLENLVRLEISSDENIKFEQKDFVVVTDVAKTLRSFPSIVFNMFDLAHENFVQRDSLQSAMSQAVSSLNLETEQEAYGCGIEPTDEDVLSRTTQGLGSTVDSAIEQGVASRFTELEQDLSTEKIEVRIVPVETNGEVIIKSCTTEVCDDLLGNCGVQTVCERDDSGNPTKLSVKKTCNFDYVAAAKVKVRLRDVGNTYPVYDGGNTDSRSLFLNFAAISCSVYDKSLCGIS